MRIFIFCLFAIVANSARTQEQFELKWSIPLDVNHAWDADQAGFLYLYNGEELAKIDTLGRKLLTQSPKSLGNIRKIDATNWLKIAVFSEEQQQVCYLDNALALQASCLQLVDYEVNLAQLVATSVQTDRLWVYDQLNSELRLITMRSGQQQQVRNLRSILDVGMPRQLFEYDNELYLTDDAGQIAIFDNFGTFIGSEKVDGTFVQPFEKALLVASGNKILAQELETGKVLPFFESTSGGKIEQFDFNGTYLYFATASELFCYRLK